MTITPTAQKGMIMPKESVYVRFVDWGCGPCTKYVVFYTYRDDDEHTWRGITDSHLYGTQFEAIYRQILYIL